MVRDPKDPFKWEKWEVENTLLDTKRDLKNMDKLFDFSSNIYLGMVIGITSGFFGSMLFSFFYLLEPTKLELEITFFVFIISFLIFFYFLFKHIRNKKRSLRWKEDFLYVVSEDGQKKLLKAFKEGKMKSYAEMSDEEIREINQRSGGVEVEPNHWIFSKMGVREWKKDQRKKKRKEKKKNGQ